MYVVYTFSFNYILISEAHTCWLSNVSNTTNLFHNKSGVIYWYKLLNGNSLQNDGVQCRGQQLTKQLQHKTFIVTCATQNGNSRSFSRHMSFGLCLGLY